MSHPARLSLRAPPHLPFIQGFPGVPGGKDRKQAAVCGTVEVRVGAQPIKAKWVRVEIRKHESLPPGFPAQGDSWELVGEIVTLWQAQGKEFDTLQTADFRFFLPLPESLPPTVEMAKGTGVWYELVAALSYKKKGGIFKADGANIMKISEPLRITKHELHAVWPVYNNPDQKSVAGQDLTMTIQRPGVAFGPGDRILLTASLRSDRPLPFKLRGFECTLLEVVSSIPDLTTSKDNKRKSKTPSNPVIKSRPIAQARCAVDESVGRGGEKSARIDMAVPTDVLVTVRNAKTLEVGYEMQVKAVCDGFEGPVVPGIKYVVGQYTRGSAQQAMRDIGHVDALCGGPLRVPQPPSTPSFVFNTPPDSGTQTPVLQGFATNHRRLSASTITTNTTIDRHGDFSPDPSTRPYSATVPNRQSLAFPVAHPAPTPNLNSPTTTSINESSYAPTIDRTQSEISHTNRQSTATMGTFGPWDRSLQTDIKTPPISQAPIPPPKPNWDSAESEKANLYNTARQAAASTQRAGGVSLDRLGLADIPDSDVAPPEYAPPVPAQPKGKYQAPIRPVSAYVSPDPSIASGLSSPELGSGATPFEVRQNGAKDVVGRDGEGVPASGSGSGSGSGLGPVTGSGSVPGVLMAGLSEKEQMKRYYEAKDRVENRGEGSGSGSGSVPAVAVAPGLANGATSTTPSGLSEKEQMRRYYAAKDMVESRAGSSSAPVSTSTPTQPSTSQTPANPSHPISEKEQMRRYYEARARVEQTQNSAFPPSASASGSGPSRDMGMGAGSGSGSGPGSGAGSGSAIVPNGTAGTSSAATSNPYPSATDEKDMMRRRYEEATNRVTRAGTSSPPMASPATFSPPPTPFASGSTYPTKPTSSSSTAYPSATDEKERMRALYEEANQRVSARTRQSLSPSLEASPGFSIPPISSNAGLSSSTSGPGPPLPPNPYSNGGSGSSYPSAEQEKESMRNRYESASMAVDKARVASGSSVGGHGSRGAGGDGGEGPGGNSYFGSNSGAGRSVSGSGSGTGSGIGMGEDSGPPPPLPSRPPADYITLLSPVTEAPPETWRACR